MTQAIAKLWQELAEVSASLSCAKDKLTSKLDQVVANVEETDKQRKPSRILCSTLGKRLKGAKSRLQKCKQLFKVYQ
jgi:hypothetical protein